MWPPSQAGQHGRGKPALVYSATCSNLHGSYINRHTCIQDKLSCKNRLGRSINRPAHPTCNTHQGVLYSFHFLGLGLVVWELESSRACSGFRSHHRKSGISSCIFPFDIYQYNLSSLSFRVRFTFVFIYLSKLFSLHVEVLSSSLGFVLFLILARSYLTGFLARTRELKLGP
jgi:hypothetical protein